MLLGEYALSMLPTYSKQQLDMWEEVLRVL